MGYSRPHSRHLRPLTKLISGFPFYFIFTASTRGKRKSPVPNMHGAFSKPFRSCLAVFYVEQVALNRHVPKNDDKKVSLCCAPRQVELFQLVRRGGISRLENDGSDVLAESWCSHRLLRSTQK